MNAYDICAIPVAIEPERECLVGGSGRLTYAELDRWTAGLALELAPFAGRRIAVLDVNSAGLVAVSLACWRAGCTVVPLNVRSRGEELRYLLERCEAPLVFAGEAYLETAATHAPGGVSVRRVPGPPVGAGAAEQLAVDVDERQVAVALFTSGSTSRPKLVELTHGNLMAHVTETTELLGDEGAAVLVAAPLFHVAAFAAVLTGLFGGRRVVLLEEFDPERWLGALERESVTHAFLVPTMLRRLLDHAGFAPRRLEPLRILSYGAAPMPPGLLDRMLQLVPDSVGLVNAFGQTETTSTVTMLGPDDHRLTGSPDEIALRRRRLRSVGRAIPGVEIAILDADGGPCAVGAIGEVGVRGVRIMRGYAGDHPAAAGAGGWLRTRDLGYLDEDGYLFLTGRGDDLMIRNGENVAPAEVEAVLLAYPAIADAAAVGIPDDDVGERIGVAVVAREGVQLDVAEMLSFAAARLAAYKRPEVLAIVDELPRSPMGKIQRPRLREMVQRQGRVIGRVASGLGQ